MLATTPPNAMPKTTKLTEKPVIPAADAVGPDAKMVVISGGNVRLTPSADLAGVVTAGLAPEAAVAQNTARLEALQSQLAAMQDAQAVISSGIAALQGQIAAIQLVPGPQGADATPAQISASVAAFFAANPIPVPANGKDAAPADIASAVASYIAAHPIKDGVTPSPADISAAVASYMQTHPVAAGSAATVAIGTITTLASGATPTVTNVGTPNAAILNMGFPAPTKGDPGLSGVISAAAPLSYDATAKSLSIALASAVSAGVISAADYLKLKNMTLGAVGGATIPALGIGETDVVITLTPPMADATYNAVASVEGTNVALGNVSPRIKSKTATTVTVTLKATVAVNVSGTVNVVALAKGS